MIFQVMWSRKPRGKHTKKIISIAGSVHQHEKDRKKTKNYRKRKGGGRQPFAKNKKGHSFQRGEKKRRGNVKKKSYKKKI